jgi:hypothetical protein
MEERIARLITRIEQELPGAANTVEWAGPTSDTAIGQVETALNVRFPASVRTFLKLTGGGGLDTFSISSIPEEDPLSATYGTVYGDTLRYREPWVPFPLPEHLVVIQRDFDDNEPFCLDTSRWTGDECPVVLYYHNAGYVEPIAENFIAFYESYLQPYFGEDSNK